MKLNKVLYFLLVVTASAIPNKSAIAVTPDWLIGDIHLHSTYSDGNGSPSDIASVAVSPLTSDQTACDFIILTDHNSELEDEWSAYLSDCNSVNSSYSSLLFLPGVEISKE